MGSAKALLLASGDYEAENITNLAIVENDIALVRTALESSRYEIHVVGVNPEFKLTRANMLKSIRQFARSATEDDTLIIYYSGHGVHFNNVDFIVPYDASFEDPEMLPEYLVPLDFPMLLKDCAAETILIIVDACREGLGLLLDPDAKAASLLPWSEGRLSISKRQHITYIYSCAAGEYSRYVDGPGGYSIFTKALAHVLGPDHPAQTLAEIEVALQEAVNTVSQEHGKARQTVRVRSERSADSSQSSRRICSADGTKAADEGSNAWRAAVSASALWDIAEPSAADLADALKARAGELAAVAEELTRKVAACAHPMPWRDDRYPLRLLSRVEFLGRELVQEFQPSYAEVAVLISTIFLQQAIRAAAFLSIDEDRIYDSGTLSVQPTGGHHARAAFHAAMSAHASVFAGSALRNDPPSQVAKATAWVALKWISQEEAFWNDGGSSFVHRKYWDQIFPEAEPGPSGAIVDRTTILFLCRQLTLVRRFKTAESYGNLLSARTHFASTKHEQVVREVLILHLLVLAGYLAIDTAFLSDVILENILVSDAVRPEELVSTLSDTEWVPIGRDRALRGRCSHPAVDLALRMHVEDANEILQLIQRKAAQSTDRLELLANLPANLLPSDVKPAEGFGPHAYLTPHIRLRLSDKKVRDLLMGERLYGSKALAIRELYQNALDACRYRAARLEALRRQNVNSPDWQGQIHFRQGVDSDGRKFIECEDNGIGMSHAILNDCFAHAGQRFADMAEFGEEQRGWRELVPPIEMSPNSQFGIGVFSYFMLGSEVRIETRRFERDGRLSEAVAASVDSRSGLFRLKTLPEKEDAGTRVRIYLAYGEGEPEVSCTDTLSSLLFVPDFHLVIEEAGRGGVEWGAGELRGWRSSRRPSEFSMYHHRHRHRSESVVRAQEENLWWCEGSGGALLADGIKTDQELKFAVVNLTGQHRPILSVDRLKIQRWNADYVAWLLRAGLPSLARAPWLSVSWVWKFGKEHPRLVGDLIAELSSLGRRLPMSEAKGQPGLPAPPTYDMGRVGCIPEDDAVIQALSAEATNRQSMPPHLIAHRCALWRLAAGETPQDGGASPSLPIMPLIETPDWLFRDRLLLSSGLNGRGPWLRGAVEPWHVFRAAADTKTSPAAIGAVLAEYANWLPLDLSRIALDQLPNTPLDQIDAYLLGDVTRGGKVWSDGQVLFTSARFSQPVCEIARRVSAFASLGVREANFSLALFEVDQVLDKADTVILEARRSWHRRSGPGREDIAALALTAEQPIQAVLDKMALLTPFVAGLVVDDATGLAGYEPESDDPILLSRRLDRKAPWIDEQVTPGHVLRAAVRLQKPVRAILDRLAVLTEPFRLILPEVDWQALDFDPLNGTDAQLVSLALDGSSPWLAGTNSAAHILAGAVAVSLPLDEVFDRLDRFSKVLGFRFNVARSDVLARSPDEFDRALLSLNMDGRHPWLKGVVTPRQIAERATHLHLPSDEVVERLLEYAGLMDLDLGLVRGFDFEALPWGQHTGSMFSRSSESECWLPAFSMRRAAAYSLHKDLPLVGILSEAKGFTNVVDYQVKPALEGKVPDDFPSSVDKMIARFGVRTSRGRERQILATDVLEIAAGLRVPPRAVVDRLIVFKELRDIRLNLPDPDDIPTNILSNDELAVLSRNGDGKSPWLRGEVSVPQMLFASHNAGLPLAQVIETLMRHQRFLSLRLSVLKPDQLEQVGDKLDCVLLSADLDGTSPWVNDVTTAHLCAFAQLVGLKVEDAKQRLARLRRLGAIE